MFVMRRVCLVLAQQNFSEVYRTIDTTTDTIALTITAFNVFITVAINHCR